MNARIISTIALAALTIAAPGPAHAQVPPPPVTPPTYQQGCPQKLTPSAQQLFSRYMHRFGPLDLSPGQQQRIQTLVNGFSQVHPAGSPLDRAAMRELRDQVRGVLTPQQLALLEQEHHGSSGPRRCP